MNWTDMKEKKINPDLKILLSYLSPFSNLNWFLRIDPAKRWLCKFGSSLPVVITVNPYYYIPHCNRWMGTDFLHIFSPHFSDMLFRCFLTKIWWILCRLKNWGLQWPLRVFFQAQKHSFYNIERPDQLQVEG